MASPRSEPSSELRRLNGLSFDALLVWLETALRGRERLPLMVPDETPESPILRERRLATRTREDLREACRRLVRRFSRESPGEDDGYVLALLRLAAGFQIPEVAVHLHALAEDAEQFAKLTERQRWAVLATLIDLRAPVSVAFWKEVAARDPQRHGVLSVAALLAHGPRSAFEVLPSLPDDEMVADALYVVLDQHASVLGPEQRARMVATLAGVPEQCAPRIREALVEWVEGQVPQSATPGDHGSQRRRLDTALAAFWSRIGTTYEPEPASARLVPCTAS